MDFEKVYNESKLEEGESDFLPREMLALVKKAVKLGIPDIQITSAFYRACSKLGIEVE